MGLQLYKERFYYEELFIITDKTDKNLGLWVKSINYS
jgi:hypothetical protein